jgi:hypothetical protein
VLATSTTDDRGISFEAISQGLGCGCIALTSLGAIMSARRKMAKKRVLLNESTVYAYHPDGPRPVGTIGWDSNSGRLWGTLGEQIRAAGEEAKRQGFVVVPGPVPSTISILVRDPFRVPKEFAAIIMSLGFNLPEAIARFYRPRFHDSRKKSDHKRFGIRGTEILY